MRPFEIGLSGFRVQSDHAADIKYAEPCTGWKCSQISDKEFTAVVSDSGLCPRKLSINLLSPGFSLYFESGIFLDFSSAECPFLTWADGSVGPDVPTPPTQWLLVSFRDSQPPLIVTLPTGSAAFSIGGRPQHWTLRTTDLQSHWIRIAAPLGPTNYPTPNVASLGALLEKIAPVRTYFLGPVPKLLAATRTEDATSITVDWQFDRPGALLPSVAYFAPLGEDPIDVLSPTINLSADDEDGPLLATATNDLKIRFPLRPFGAGRALNVNSITAPAPAETPPTLSNLVRLGFENLLASASRTTRDLAEKLPKEFILSARDAPEPFTGQRLPFDEAGNGMDKTAAFALLKASDSLAQNDPQPNPLLLSLLLRRSWDSWILGCANQDLSRRATALASLAAVMSSNPAVRQEGCMMEAGLAAQRGARLWRGHHGYAAETSPLLECLPKLRDALFRGQADPFFGSLQGAHVLSSMPIAAKIAKEQTLLDWEAVDPSEYDFEMLAPTLSVKAGHNVVQLSSESAPDGGIKVNATTADAGLAEISIYPALSLPAYVAPPLYTEEHL